MTMLCETKKKFLKFNNSTTNLSFTQLHHYFIVDPSDSLERLKGGTELPINFAVDFIKRSDSGGGT